MTIHVYIMAQTKENIKFDMREHLNIKLKTEKFNNTFNGKRVFTDVMATTGNIYQ